MLQTYATSRVVHSISFVSIFELCPLELCKYQFLSKSCQLFNLFHIMLCFLFNSINDTKSKIKAVTRCEELVPILHFCEN